MFLGSQKSWRGVVWGVSQFIAYMGHMPLQWVWLLDPLPWTGYIIQLSLSEPILQGIVESEDSYIYLASYKGQ